MLFYSALRATFLTFLIISLHNTAFALERPEYVKYIISKKSGGGITLYLEEAKTPHKRAKGLMNKPMLQKHHGMIFLFDEPTKTSFWMKNTLIPLDLILIDQNRNIINIFYSLVPGSLTKLNSKIPISHAIELNAGEAKELGINIGDKLVIP